MSLKYNYFNLLLFAFCVYLKCVFTLDASNHSTGKEVLQDENTRISAGHKELGSVGAIEVNKKNDDVLFQKHIKVVSQSENLDRPNVSTKGTSQLVLEGGGTVDLSSTVQPNGSPLGTEPIEENNNHSKGSKPRKGVQHPGSSVVPRKGVNALGAFSLNQSSAGAAGTKEPISIISDKGIPINKTESKVQIDHQEPNGQPTLNKVSHHKPVFVTDEEDVDDFEKYPIIQTSTTGEDYIIIGIVIVLGIWCSIFGALIFYRRAGEYWDRRHYRRMDFLVEGMYND